MEKVKITNMVKFYTLTLLYEKPRHGYEIIKTLIKSGAKVDAKDEQGRTALTKAVSLGKVEAARTLVAAKADLDAKDTGGWTPLMYAAELGKWKAAKFLVKKGADVNAKDNAGWTPLVHAFADMHLTGAEFLISKGARAGAASDEHLYYPLRLAAKQADKKFSRLLDKLE